MPASYTKLGTNSSLVLRYETLVQGVYWLGTHNNKVSVTARKTCLLKQLAQIVKTTPMCNQKSTHINQTWGHRGLCPFVQAAPVRGPPVRLQVSTQRHSSWHSQCQGEGERERGRRRGREIEFHFLFSRDTEGGQRERGGCELISRYIVSCHFNTAQNILTVWNPFFSISVDKLKAEQVHSRANDVNTPVLVLFK